MTTDCNSSYSSRRRYPGGFILLAAGLLCGSACAHRGALPSRLEGVVPQSEPARPAVLPEEMSAAPARPAEVPVASPAPEPHPSSAVSREAGRMSEGSPDDFIDVDDKHWFRKSWPMAVFLALLGAAAGIF